MKLGAQASCLQMSAAGANHRERIIRRAKARTSLQAGCLRSQRTPASCSCRLPLRYAGLTEGCPVGTGGGCA